MRFSDHFGITKDQTDDWFDPVLSVDTELFIDPFLLYAHEKEPFAGSHEEIIAFFNSCFQLIAKSADNPSSIHYRRAVDLLIFPEVEEICLGYTSRGTAGSGSGRELAGLTAVGMWKAIQAGLVQISHFEEIALLQKGIGADRISDITAGILRRRIGAYTLSVCRKHDVPVRTFRFYKGHFNLDTQRWVPLILKLPANQISGKSILLLPRRYLRTLPSINADDFWDYCWNNENETIRRDFNYDVSRNVSKSKIVQIARNHPEFRSAYLKHREGNPTKPYDFYKDSEGLVGWPEASKQYCADHPLDLGVSSETEFVRSIETMLKEFRHFVEENGGWRLLWNDNGNPRKEKAAQLLFLGIVSHYCHANDIDISREADIGRGPVDFKVSRGYNLRVLLELKLAKNSRFWHGLERQLPTYQLAESIDKGYFIVVAFNKQDFERIKNIQSIVEEVRKRTGRVIKPIIVDATPDRPSASRL